MKLSTLCAAAFCCAAVAGPAAANEVEASLGNKFGELLYTRDAAPVSLPDGDLTVAMLMTENNNLLAHATLDMEVLAEKTPVEFKIGARLYLASLVEPDDDIMGLGFGASGRFRLPFDRLPLLKRFPFYIAASIYFSPEITTSGAGVDVTDIHVIRGELELAPNILGVVGLRSLDIDRASGAQEDIVDERVYAGVRIRF